MDFQLLIAAANEMADTENREFVQAIRRTTAVAIGRNRLTRDVGETINKAALHALRAIQMAEDLGEEDESDDELRQRNLCRGYLKQLPIPS